MLKIHCKSKDDDLVIQTLERHDSFEFSSAPSFWEGRGSTAAWTGEKMAFIGLISTSLRETKLVALSANGTSRATACATILKIMSNAISGTNLPPSIRNLGHGF
ncbi:hypothetical protein LINPERPRIM_LOCUS1370 [Linum perenne]